MPMDILIVSRCPPGPLTSGDRVLLYYLARELHARGHRLDLLALQLDGEEPPDAAVLRPFRSFEAIAEHRRTAADYVVRLARPFPNAARACWNPEMWKAIERRLAERRYDVAHFFGGIQVYEFRNAVVGRLPVIIVPYDSYSLSVERDLARARIGVGTLRLWGLRTAARAYERVSYQGFARVVLVTMADNQSLKRRASSLPTAVIPNGVAGEFLLPLRREAGAPILLFVGNFAYPPNAEAARILVDEILPRVQAAVPSARVSLVGADPPADLIHLSRPDVDVTGRVADVRPYLEESACFVSPLMSGSGMRNKVLEAMAGGLPVAATPLSCEGIPLTPGKDVLMGGTPAELAAAAVRFLQDPILWRDLAMSAQTLVRRELSWERTAERYEALYRSVMDEAALAEA